MQLGSLLDMQKNYSEAINAIKLAQKYSPNAPETYIKLAEIYLKTNNPENSVSNLEKALEISPKNIEAIKLMLLALYDKRYAVSEKDKDRLTANRLRYFDKLEAISPEEADAMRKKLGVKRE
jgi:tetratricopeptide (TPR) repeat protein